MKGKLQLALWWLFFPILVSAQFIASQPQNIKNTINCLADQLHQKRLNENDLYANKHFVIEQQIYAAQNEFYSASAEFVSTEVIPIVVHIIHQNGQENISDAQIFNAIQQLNDAFANVGDYDPSTGVGTEIQFCLAQRDPDGNPSNGINRIESTLTNLTVETQDFDLKALLQWNPLDYLNVWVVNEINSLSSGSGVQGYAYLPASHGASEDGIVVEANTFGTSSDNSKVMVHEAGHYLGLYHTFEGGCSNDDCQINGDRVCDTPPDQSTAAINCGATINSCTTDEDDTSTNNPFRSIALGGVGDQNDMFINYMDYGLLECPSAFTQGQKERMNNALSIARQSLLESFGCFPPCSLVSFDASFTASIPSPILPGSTINILNTSDPADLYQWTIDGQFFSNEMNTNYTFPDEGVFNIQLTIRDTINNCESNFEMTMEVDCPGAASFLVSANQAMPGETIEFSNTSIGNTSYEWYVEDSLYSTNNDLNITFDIPGYYSVYLVGMTADCFNYSSTITIIVGNCIKDKSEMHWYFGDHAAIDFNAGEPELLLNSELYALEGSASISDRNTGELLFYTNGVTVWDKSNNVMPNGEGLLGGALTSAFNQVLIIPCPGNNNQYYIFTCDEGENSYQNGIRYSKVDMTLNNGLGGITNIKNEFLSDVAWESMAAVYHQDEKKVWLVIPNLTEPSVKFFLIDSSGINSPTISDFNDGSKPRNLIFSHNGEKLIMPRTIPFNNKLTIFDFDRLTGELSNPLDISSPSFDGALFAELSPDHSKLYVSAGDLLQFDLSQTTSQAIQDSETIIGEAIFLDRLLLAPNGKIYQNHFSNPFLSAINSPNETGLSCDYAPNVINLSPASGEVSFPKFIRGLSDKSKLDIFSPEEVCTESTATIEVEFPNPDCTYSWYLNDSLINPSQGDTLLFLNSSIEETYTIRIAGTCSCGVVENTTMLSFVEPGAFNLGPDPTICISETIVLEAGNQYVSYMWQDGSNSSTYIGNPGNNYWVEVIDSIGCVYNDTIEVFSEEAPPLIDLGPDQSLCSGLVAFFDAGSGDYTYQWQDGSTSSSYTAWSSGTYWVATSNACGITTDTILLEIDSLNLVDLGEDLFLCESTDIILDAGNNGSYYLWQDGTDSSFYLANTPGWYWVDVTNLNGCSESDSIYIALDDSLPTIDCPSDLDTIVSFGTSTILLNPALPTIFDNCPTTLTNDFTNTANATANYPPGVTILTWTVTDDAGNQITCSMNVIVDVLNETQNLTNPRSFMIYPNPGDGLFFLENIGNSKMEIQLQITDQVGRVIQKHSKIIQSQFLIDLSEQAAGVYYLHCSTLDKNEIIKLVLIR